jgi:hypothetical protein
MVPENLFLHSKAYSCVVVGDGAGDLRIGREFARFPSPPPKTCPPIKYPQRKPELTAKLAEVIILPAIRLLVYTEW